MYSVHVCIHRPLQCHVCIIVAANADRYYYSTNVITCILTNKPKITGFLSTQCDCHIDQKAKRKYNRTRREYR